MSTIDVPGGTATLRHPDDMTARHRRPLQVITATLGVARFREIIAAQAETFDEAIVEIGLTENEHALLFRMTDATIYALLAGWTLPAPLPADVDEVQDIPAPVYDRLAVETAKVMSAFLAASGVAGDGTPIDRFGVDSVEDPASPTGASAGSTGSSAAGATRRTSKATTKRSGGTPRTATGRPSGSRTSSSSTTRGKRSSG